MTLSTIYIARHGYRSNWIKDVPQPPPPTGIEADPVLAEHGVEQAQELKDFLLSEKPTIQRIYSSPFYRCLQTIEPLAEALDLPILVEAGVGEWYHKNRPSHPKPASLTVLNGFFPRVDINYKPLIYVDPTGETEAEIHERCKKAIHTLIDDVNTKHPDVNTIVIACHAASKIALGRGLLGDPNAEIRTGTCSVDKYVLDKDHWKGDYIGKTSFLKGGEEMHWQFDMLVEAGSNEDIENRRKAAEAAAKDTVDVFIPLDFSAAVDKTFTVLPEDTFQAVDLDSDHPLFKIGKNIYQGDWAELLGTELYFDMDGNRLPQVTNERIVLHKARMLRKILDDGDDKAKGSKLREKIKEINSARSSAQ